MCNSTTTVHRNGLVMQICHKICRLDGRCHLPMRNAILLCCICLMHAACVFGSNCSSTVINVSKPLSAEDFHAILDTLHIENGHDSIANFSGADESGENSTAGNMTLRGVMNSYGIKDNTSLSPQDFSNICPTLIQQQLLSSCENEAPKEEIVNERHLPTMKERYGYGTLAVVIINYLPLALLFIIPGVHHRSYPYMMNVLVALATSTLICDAAMHLIPECLGLEEEDEEEGSSAGPKPLVNSALSKILVLLGAIYGMYLLEMLIGTRQKAKLGGEGGHGHSHGGGGGHSHFSSEKAAPKHSHGHSHEHTHGMHTHGMPPATDGHATHSHGMVPPCETELASYENCAVSLRPEENSQVETSLATSGHAKNGEAKNYVEKNEKPVRSLKGLGLLLKAWAEECVPSRSFGWMVIISDILHNLMDGIAMGAAFSESPMLGTATSLAILFHEIPHEIGDFAALMMSGLTWRAAFVWQIVQTISAFVGLYVGIGASADEHAQQWIFALTAGIFFHVSLSELLPELHNIKSNFWAFFFLQNLGIAIGFAIMFVIALYEGQLESAFA